MSAKKKFTEKSKVIPDSKLLEVFFDDGSDLESGDSSSNDDLENDEDKESEEKFF